MLGDLNLWEKSMPYQPSVGIPLVIAGPGIRQMPRCELPTTHIDLAATCLEYAGVPVPADMDSRSMKLLLEGKTDQHREFVRSGLYKWRMVFDGRFKLVKNLPISDSDKNQEEMVLFDLQNDPHEENNIAQLHPEIVQELSQHFITA